MTLDPTPEPDGQAVKGPPLSQPRTKSRLGRFFDKLGLVSTIVTILGFILAIIMAVATWVATAESNNFARKSYQLSLYQACRSYKAGSIIFLVLQEQSL